jgi:hypothetical protein
VTDSNILGWSDEEQAREEFIHVCVKVTARVRERERVLAGLLGLVFVCIMCDREFGKDI